MPKSKIVLEEPAGDAVALDVEEAPELLEAAEIEPEPTAIAAAPAVAAAPGSGRKALGGKEVIPFKWKLIGSAEGLCLTLFKAVEREDAEAQLERVQREGYYGELRILDVAEKVVQTKAAKAKAAEVVRDRKAASTAPITIKQHVRKTVPPKTTVLPPERPTVKREKPKQPSPEKAAKSKSSAKAVAKRPVKKK